MGEKQGVENIIKSDVWGTGFQHFMGKRREEAERGRPAGGIKGKAQ